MITPQLSESGHRYPKNIPDIPIRSLLRSPLRIGGTILMLALSCISLRADSFTFAPPNTTQVQTWSHPTIWSGDPVEIPYPNGATHDVIINGSTQTDYNLTIDIANLEIGSLTYNELASGREQRLFVASAAESYTLKIGSFLHKANYLVVLGSGDGTGALSVEIADFELRAGSPFEVGSSRASKIAAFKVTGTSTIAGNLYFDGTNHITNRIELGQLDLQTGGTVVLGGRGNSGGTVSVTSLTGGGIVQGAFTSTHNGASGTLEIDSRNVSPVTFTGVLRNTSNATRPSVVTLVKKGEGAQILSGNGNLYSGGTEISGGILAIHHSLDNVSVLGTGAVKVKDGGTLAASGAGTVRLGDGEALTVESGGKIAPGALNTGFAELKLNGAANGNTPILAMEAGASFTFNLGLGDLSDRISFLAYQGANDFLANGAAVNLNNVQEGIFVLFRFYSDELATPTATGSGLGDGALTLQALNGFTGTFHYDEIGFGGLGTLSVHIVAVPEPANMALMGCAMLVLLIRMRTRKKTSIAATRNT